MLALLCAAGVSGVLAGCAARDKAPLDAAGPSSDESAESLGLRIEELAPGGGAVVRPRDTVTIEFSARLAASGAEYDSTARRKRPLTIDLTNPNLIRGLREGIPGMREGGRRRIFVPWVLGYGEHGRPPVPPKADLQFEVTVVKVGG